MFISPTSPQRVKASCLVLWIIFSTWLSKCAVFKSFFQKKKTYLLLYILIVNQSSVTSQEWLILVCECAFSFWFLLLFLRIIFVLPSRCLFFFPFLPDSACPCILNDWNLILQVLVWQTSCNDRPLSQYFVTFLSPSLYSCCRNKYNCWYCWNAYRLIFLFSLFFFSRLSVVPKKTRGIAEL